MSLIVNAVHVSPRLAEQINNVGRNLTCRQFFYRFPKANDPPISATAITSNILINMAATPAYCFVCLA